MSIIYGTLTRLEEENALLTDATETGGAHRDTPVHTGFPLKTVSTILFAALIGIGLTIWQVGGLRNPAPQAATTVTTARLAWPENVDLAAATGLVPQSAVPVDASPPPAATVAPEVAVAEPPAADVADPVPAAAVEQPVAVAEAQMTPVAAATVAEEVVPIQAEQPAMADLPGPAQVDEMEELIDRARVALSRGYYTQALSILDSLDTDSNRADFWLVKGSAHLGLAELEDAEAAFAAAQHLAPDNVHLAVQRAVVKQEQGDHVGALEILAAAEKDNPDVPEIYLNKGYSYYALGAVREAKRSFRVFLRLTENRSLYAGQRGAVESWLQQVAAI